MTYIGIDVGSTYTKYFIFAANKIKIFTEYTPVRQHEYFEKKLCAFYNHYCDCKIVSCGYGKRNVKSVKSVTELTALATGLNAQCPQINIALDIGGQDTKIIRQQDGNLKDFFINDKCAAGSGLFLINTLNILDMVFDDIDLAACTSDVKLSTTCAVFAQSEIVELIADGVSPEKIVAATLRQI
ncbi:MAG: BadF/BadG/BcrA/BcrD ATPase family protein, partial [Hydrogenoanaerobacterium sp.]